ncbi:aminotransferase class III-fold pyridoxal phosphate-dependent enzyme [Siccirubricoccus deserti]
MASRWKSRDYTRPILPRDDPHRGRAVSRADPFPPHLKPYRLATPQQQEPAHERHRPQRHRSRVGAGGASRAAGRGFGNFASDIILREGRGGRVWDVSGNEFVDYLLGSGPMFIGHSHPEVVEAVLAQIPKGTTFFANNEHGIRLAEAIVEAFPCAEQVRFVSSGSEADMYALRVARAFRKRDRILKFEGGYHGMSDWGLMSLAPKQLANFPVAVPDSAGIPRSVQEEVLVAPSTTWRPRRR